MFTARLVTDLVITDDGRTIKTTYKPSRYHEGGGYFVVWTKVLGEAETFNGFWRFKEKN